MEETHINRQVIVMQVLEAVGLGEQRVQHLAFCIEDLLL